jgi:hypothetical protein
MSSTRKRLLTTVTLVVWRQGTIITVTDCLVLIYTFLYLVAYILMTQVKITLTVRMVTLWGLTQFCIRNVRGFTAACHLIFQKKCICIYRLSRTTRPAHLIFFNFVIVTIFDIIYEISHCIILSAVLLLLLLLSLGSTYFLRMFGDVWSGVIRFCGNLNLVHTVVMLIAKGKKYPIRYN